MCEPGLAHSLFSAANKVTSRILDADIRNSMRNPSGAMVTDLRTGFAGALHVKIGQIAASPLSAAVNYRWI